MKPFIYEWVKSILTYVEEHGFDRDLSFDQIHAVGLSSLVVKRKPDGGLLRIFYTILPLGRNEIQLHTNRYGITITPLTEGITHLIAEHSSNIGAIQLPAMRYQSIVNPIDGVKGGVTDSLGIECLKLHETVLPLGSQVYLTCDDIHTVIADQMGHCWIVEEHPVQDKDSNVVYGIPFEPLPPVKFTPDGYEFGLTSSIIINILKEYLDLWENNNE